MKKTVRLTKMIIIAYIYNSCTFSLNGNKLNAKRFFFNIKCSLFMVIFACMSCVFLWIAVVVCNMVVKTVSKLAYNEVQSRVFILYSPILSLESKRVIFQLPSNFDCRNNSSEESDHFIPVVSVAMYSIIISLLYF